MLLLILIVFILIVFKQAAWDEKPALCIDVNAATDLCAAMTGCTGVQMVAGKDLAYMVGSYASLDNNVANMFYSEDFVFWQKKADTNACQADADFSDKVGSMSLTSRPDVDQVWILTVDKEQTIEVPGSNLDYKKDRVMVSRRIGFYGIESLVFCECIWQFLLKLW